jgi:hypothetical protein
MDVKKFLKKSLACLCCLCVDCNFSACGNLPWTKNSEVEVLIPNSVGYVCSPWRLHYKKMSGIHMEMMVITLLFIFQLEAICCECKRRK